jgi:hypothetical protein
MSIGQSGGVENLSKTLKIAYEKQRKKARITRRRRESQRGSGKEPDVIWPLADCGSDKVFDVTLVHLL